MPDTMQTIIGLEGATVFVAGNVSESISRTSAPKEQWEGRPAILARELRDFSASTYFANRTRISADDLAPCYGKWVAFSTDGNRIIAYSESESALFDAFDRLGLRPTDYILESIPECDTLFP